MYHAVLNNCFDLITFNDAHSSKRFHRLMKEHGIYQKSSPHGREGLLVTPKSTPAKSGKKRKLDLFTEPREETDDEEPEQVKKESGKKSRKTSGAASGKKEEEIAMGLASPDDESMLSEGESGKPEDMLKAAVKVEEHVDEV